MKGVRVILALVTVFTVVISLGLLGCQAGPSPAAAPITFTVSNEDALWACRLMLRGLDWSERFAKEKREESS